MILKFLLNTRKIWMVFMKTLKNTIQTEKHKVLIVFDDMIANALSNRKLQPVVTESLTRGRKLNIFLVFIIQSCFAVPKNIRLNSNCYL